MWGGVVGLAKQTWKFGKTCGELVKSGIYTYEAWTGKELYDAYGVTLITQCKMKFNTKVNGGNYQMDEAYVKSRSIEELESLRQILVTCANMDEDILYTYGKMKDIGENKYSKHYYTETMGLGHTTTYLWGLIGIGEEKIVFRFNENDYKYEWLSNDELGLYGAIIRNIRNAVEHLPNEYKLLFP